jgi:hypothetical protein
LIYFNFLIVIESFALALFIRFKIKILVLTKSSCPKRDVIECTSAIFTFLCGKIKIPPTPAPPPHPPPAATDWLGVGLKIRSFCRWLTCQTGKKQKLGGLMSIYTVIMAGYR